MTSLGSPYSVVRLLFLISESILVYLSILLGAVLRLGPDAIFMEYSLIYKAILVVIIYQLCLYYLDLYDLNYAVSHWDLGIRLLQGLGATSIVLAIIYYVLPHMIIGRGIALLSIVILGGTFYLWRLAITRWLLMTNKVKERLLVLGTGEMARKVVEELMKNRATGYQVVGFVSDNQEKVGMSLINPKVIATTEQLLPKVKEEGINRIIVALPDRRGKLPLNSLLDCKLHGVKIEEGISFYERVTGKLLVDELRPGWLIFSDGFIRSRPALLLKTVIDFSVALFALILFLPLMFLIALLIKLDTPGPVLYKQERVGRDGKVFTLYKFRTMLQDAEEGIGPVWAEEDDPRITRIGNLLRKTRIDELPQLINILKKDMSFVGPRPERPFFVKQLQQEIPYYDQRHVIRPGITGWAQVRYCYASSIEDAKEKLCYDLYYIKHASILLDLFIIFETVKIVIFGRGAR
jgi:sugar transferase (PEP-CTERM system associated)